MLVQTTQFYDEWFKIHHVQKFVVFLGHPIMPMFDVM